MDRAAVIDYVGGLEDLDAGLLRLIGDPETRYREDPVRMLRMVRFAAKLGLRIDPDTEAPLFKLGPLLEHIPPARLFEETLKLFMGGGSLDTFECCVIMACSAICFPLRRRASLMKSRGSR